jgi:protein-histidine N-methyltransferase
MRAPDEAMQRFEGWLREAGVRMPSLEIRQSFGSRKVCARTAIRPGEAVLQVPSQCILTAEVAQESVLGAKIRASGISLSNPQSYLAAFLLEQRCQADSWWAPYIGILPATFPNLPLSFSGSELEMLKGSFTLKMIEDLRREIRQDYQSLRERVCGFHQFSYPEFEWACQVVGSRVFVFEAGGQQMRGLVPMADLLDHKMPTETKWSFDSSAHVFTVNALRDFQAGEAVHDTYGRKCNSRLFVDYGFVLPDNQDNEAAIDLPAPSPDHPFYNLLGLLGKPMVEGGQRFQVPIDARAAERVLSYLRVLCIAPNENPTVLGGSTQSFVRAISRRNEAAALSVLLTACQDALSAFDTTLAEDEALLGSPSLTTNAHNSLIVRRGEKRVLHHYREMAETVIPRLRLFPSEFARIASAPRFPLPCFSAPGHPHVYSRLPGEGRS